MADQLDGGTGQANESTAQQAGLDSAVESANNSTETAIIMPTDGKTDGATELKMGEGSAPGCPAEMVNHAGARLPPAGARLAGFRILLTKTASRPATSCGHRHCRPPGRHNHAPCI